MQIYAENLQVFSTFGSHTLSENILNSFEMNPNHTDLCRKLACLQYFLIAHVERKQLEGVWDELELCRFMQKACMFSTLWDRTRPAKTF